jgi:hypothetical protein
MQKAMQVSNSKLIDSFCYKAENPEESACLFEKFPQNYFFVDCKLGWKLQECQFGIARKHHANPISGKQVHLQLQVTLMLSSKSYKDLRTVNVTIYKTFLWACVAFGLLEDDWE